MVPGAKLKSTALQMFANNGGNRRTKAGDTYCGDFLFFLSWN